MSEKIYVNGADASNSNPLPTQPMGKNVGLEVILQNAVTVPANGTPIYMGGADTIKITEISGASTSRTIIFEVSNLQNGTYSLVQGVKLADLSLGTQTTNISEIWQFDGLAGLWFRARVSAVTGIMEVASLAVTAAPTASGNVTVTLDTVATNVAVQIGVAQVESLTTTAAPTSNGNVIVTLDTVATNVAVQIGVAQVESLQITNTTGATTAGNVTVTLDGVATPVALLTSDNTPALVATKIRATAFTGWTTGGATDTITFTSTTNLARTSATYSAGTTGAAGTMTRATAGVTPDTATDVATKIRGTAFTGWTTGGATTTVTFTSNTKLTRTSAIYSAGTTGATGTMTRTTQGITPDTSTDVATKIRATAFIGWNTGGTGTTVTFTATTDGDKIDAIYSAGTTGATGTMTISTQGVSASLMVKGKVIA